MSKITASVPVVAAERRHTAARTLAMASHRPPRVSASMSRKVRYSVESDGTEPNSSAWARRCSMSAQHSPPPASINMAWVNTLPRSWSGSRSPVRGMRAESEWPSPNRSAKVPRACSPTWATTCSPPPSTTTATVLLAFTSEVPSCLGFCVSRQPQFPLPGERFRGPLLVVSGYRGEGSGLIKLALIKLTHYRRASSACERDNLFPEGSSSTGRAPVSKTGGWGFESLLPCSTQSARTQARTQPMARRWR